MSSTSSLLTRIKDKQNGVVAPVLQILSDEESDSDIDDDITIEQCAELINQTYTKNEPCTKPQTSLRHLVAQKSVERSKSYPLGDMTNNEPLSADIPSNLDLDSLGSAKSYDNNETKTISTNILKRQIVVSSMSRNSSSSTETVDSKTSHISVSPPPLKRKRPQLTAEERKAIKEKKDREKLERQQAKKQERLEKAMQKEIEKAKKKANTLNNRNVRKDECMEKMLAVIDSSLIQEHNDGPDILKSLQDVNVRYEVKPLPFASSIGWMRENITYDVGEDSQITKKSQYSEEAHILYVMSASDLVCRINQEIENCNGDTFSNLISQLRKSYPTKKLSIVITGMEAYHRLVKTKHNQQFRKNVTNIETKSKKKSTLPLLGKKQIDDVIVRTQITTDISVRFRETSLGSFVVEFTKAVAEAPFKKSCEDSLYFSVTAPSDKMSVKISDDGHGILQLWNQQLQQFYGVRNDTAAAITQAYSSPLALMKAYKDLSVEDGEKLLQDIQVRRGVGVLQTQRRVGIELSKRLYKLFTSTDGEEPLAK